MEYALVNGIILNGHENMTPQKGKVILIENDRIKDIRPEGEVLSGYQRIDLHGQYVMPGLINMHVHLAGNGKPQKKQRDNKKLVNMIFATHLGTAAAYQLVSRYAEYELLSGVTTIRTVGGLRDIDTRVRDEINHGVRIGPRILAANEGITVPGGHMAGSVAIAAESIDEAVRMVRKRAGQGVDLIKIMVTGGVMDAKEKGVPGEMKMDPAMIKAVCEEAHRLGFKVAAHVESSAGVKAALENGVDSIEHGAVLDDEMVRLFKENGSFLITTLSPALPYALFDRSVSNASEVEQYNGKVVFDGIVECSKQALANGIPVGLGNDVGCPWVSQYDFWRELVYFHKYVGVSNAFALYTATLRNAQLAGIADSTGSIDKGKCAELIVTKENPLDNLQALRNISMVIKDGNVIRDPKVRRRKIVDEELDKFL
ncbi:MAG: amidohydrolase family protein [Solobacterium sp.]|nr:amidohydrolase family protein [Solobacterium sp.]